jgi:hypothetical protein
MAERRPLVQVSGIVQELPSGDTLPGGGGGGGSTAINDIADATAAGVVNCGNYEISLEWPDLTGGATGDAFVIVVDGFEVIRTAFNGGTICTLGGNFVGIGDSNTSLGVYIDPSGPIYIGTGSSTLVVIGNSSGTQTLGFFGAAGATKQTVSAASTGVMDGAIGALSFSSTPTQAECEALRDQCESLRDWIEEVRTRSNELNIALGTYGLISNGL